LSFWDSFIIKSMVDDLFMGYAGWAIWEYIVYWDSNDTSFSPRFCGFGCKSSRWAVNFASMNLDPKAYSSRLVSLATSSLRLLNSFRCWTSNWGFSSLSICLFHSQVL
jgi:hypothetical protein